MLCQTSPMPTALTYAAAFLYLIAAAWQAHALAHHARAARTPRLLGLFAALLHAAVHLLIWHAGHGVDLHFFSALSLIGLGTALLASDLSLLRPVAALGVLVYPIAAASLVLYRHVPHAPSPALGWQIHLHAGLALLAYAALSLSALLALMLWWQEQALRQRRLDGLLRMLPPLTLSEALMFRLIAAGFALLTLALLSGVVFVQNLLGQHLLHKSALSLLAWAMFGILLLGRMRQGWRGPRAVRLVLIAMALLGLAFFGSKFVLELVLERSA